MSPSIVVDGLRNRPDSIQTSQQAILSLWRQAMTGNTIDKGAERQLLSRVNDVDPFEGMAERVSLCYLHSRGIIENNMGRLETGNPRRIEIDEGLHTPSDVQVLHTVALSALASS